MRIGQTNPSVLTEQYWTHNLILFITFLTGALTDEDVIQSVLGGSASFSFKVTGDMTVTQTELSRCPDQKVFVFSPQYGLSILDNIYAKRLSVESNHSFQLEKLQESDFRTYCYKLTTFPDGSLTGEIKLVKKTDNGHSTLSEPSDSPITMIISLTCGIGFAVLCGIIAGVVCYKKRSKVQNPVHTALHSGSRPYSQPSVLQIDQDQPSSTRRQSEEEVENDDGNYLNVP
ncbi:uncharacterized protein LOC127440073 isoform X2 [Myxocyprinus asiaticus]|uniref:uncharacterized protein LOC127440073 isoform X2 n=1 Tax=Myxocyprinus asiaticus TaxID=70543 RepID=UPI00222138ED|nr:uncharacterized protein LOC127440073 isoform X2 [Myxocyprinus asiaticus]